jgi:hypothetical protein
VSDFAADFHPYLVNADFTATRRRRNDMIRSIRTLTLGVAAAAAFIATPAFAQKTGGPTPVTEVDKAARSAVHITYDCNEVQVCHTDYQLPTGMILVVETISGRITDTQSLPAPYLEVQTWLNGGDYDWNFLELPVTRRDNGPFAGMYYDFYVHAVRAYSDRTPTVFFSKNYSEGRVSLIGYLVKK